VLRKKLYIALEVCIFGYKNYYSIYGILLSILHILPSSKILISCKVNPDFPYLHFFIIAHNLPVFLILICYQFIVMDTNPQESEHFLQHSDLLFRIRTKLTSWTSQTLKTSILALVDVTKTSRTPQCLRTLYSRQGHHGHSIIKDGHPLFFP
jgi:hypothetical protein